jgi:hypothetical protein
VRARAVALDAGLIPKNAGADRRSRALAALDRRRDLQAGGRRSDPGWLHWESPAKARRDAAPRPFVFHVRVPTGPNACRPHVTLRLQGDGGDTAIPGGVAEISDATMERTLEPPVVWPSDASGGG